MAKAMAQAGFEASKQQDLKDASNTTPDEAAERPQLKKDVQSRELLADQAQAKPKMRPPRKRLRRGQPLQVKQSPSSANLGSTTGAPTTAVSQRTAVKAKAAPPPALKTEATASPMSQAVTDCLQRSSTDDILHAQQSRQSVEAKGNEKENEKAKDQEEKKKENTEKGLEKEKEKGPEKEKEKGPEKEKEKGPEKEKEKGPEREKKNNKENARAPSPEQDPESSSEDSSEMREKERQVKAKKEAHARYMRFSRSLTSILALYVGIATLKLNSGEPWI